MLDQHLRGYLLAGFEPEFDCADGAAAAAALAAAQCVVVLTPYVTDVMRDYADVILPLAAFTETGGSFVNGEGRWQTFEGALKPAGEARPGWKILRVLANLLDLPGFDYDDVAAVRGELQAAVEAVAFVPPAVDPRRSTGLIRRPRSRGSATGPATAVTHSCVARARYSSVRTCQRRRCTSMTRSAGSSASRPGIACVCSRAGR